MVIVATCVLIVVSVVLVYAYEKTIPPSPRICGTKTGPPVTSPRIRLSDGRDLAYRERGVPRDKAIYKVILVHGYNSSKDVFLPLSQETMEELGLCIVTYDRAGYGESDPNPKRTVKSEAFDIQQLSDHLQLGPKFHLIGLSVGSHAVWASLKYIPHRIAGATLVVPMINYWWPSFPPKLVNEVSKKRPKSDINFLVAHYAPSLLYWWMSQNWSPFDSATLFTKRDMETMTLMPNEDKARQQGEYESLHRDLIVHFSNWEFDPMELEIPFPQNEGGRVYLWQGHEDNVVPFELQRYLANQLPWIRYHEVPDGGHLLIHDKCFCEAIIRQLLLGEEPPLRLG